MNSHEEISSTEKLLNVIRGEENRGSEPPKDSPRRSSRNRESSNRKETNKQAKPKKVRGSSKMVNVGVSLGRERLVLVKSGQISEKRWRTLGHRVVPYPVGIGPESADFPAFLKSVLSDFCSDSHYQIWTTVPSQSVDIRRILIPKVARNEVPEAIFWTFKKESPFDDARVVFDFEIEGEVRDNGVSKIAVIAYTAGRQDVNNVKSLFEKAGFPLNGLTAPPFYVQNLFRTSWLPSPGEALAVLYVGDERSRIDIFSGPNLVLTRGIKAGIHSLTEALVESYNEQWRYSNLRMAEQRHEDFGQEITLEITPDGDDPGLVQEIVLEPDSTEGFQELTMESASRENTLSNNGQEISTEGPPPIPASAREFSRRDPKEPQSLDLDIGRRVLLWETGESKPLEQGDPGYGLSADEVFDFTLPAADRLVRQLERTLSHFHNNPGSGKVTKILVSGLLNSHRPFVNYIGEQLALVSESLDPWEPGLPLSGGLETPSKASERAWTAPALCLSLSSNERTPNLLYTHEQREAESRVGRVNNIIIIVFMLFLLPAVGFYFWEMQGINTRKTTIETLTAELHQFAPKQDIGKMVVRASEVRKFYGNIVENSKRYQAVAALNELARVSREMQPHRVELLGVSADFQVLQSSKNEKAGKAAQKGDSKTGSGTGLVLEGIVIGERELLESTLTTFWMHVDSSPMFSGATIHKSEIQTFPKEGEVLHFFMKLNVA
ncbi:MAG: hypothetical protein JEZ02_19815 [Desulfatibacillum sp.]|nr:hypothetical protein [Desulfatibacillum sp.]